MTERYHFRNTPLVTPLVDRQPCHSLNSLLWQHNPSGPIAVVQQKHKKDKAEVQSKLKDIMEMLDKDLTFFVLLLPNAVLRS